MALSSDLITQFVKVTKNTEKPQSETTVLGTTVEYNGSTYVRLDGSDILTPVSTTTNIKDAERVTVLIKDHTATVTGNLTSPSARGEDVEKVAEKISEFEIIVAYKVTATDLEALNATIDSLRAKVAKFDNVDALNADIDNLQAKIADVEYLTATDIEAINGDFENIQAQFGQFTDISAEELEAMNADIDILKAYTADFTYVSADVLSAMKAEIKDLDVKKLSVEDAEVKYANIDFSNIGKAAMENFYANSGLIENVVVGDGIITGNLVGVTIKGDLIEGNTIVAEKLVIKGTDGLYYKLNTDGVTVEEEQTNENSIDGSIITANSITATKISVDDLVAFDATIGGFHISDNSIFSGVKESVDNTTRGIYLDNDGQIAFGDSNNFIKYYKDQNGVYRLEISAGSILLRSTNTTTKDLETIVQDAENAVESVKDLEERVNSGEFKGEDATTLRIDSSRGTVFKNSAVSTVLSVVVYHGSKRITDITALKEEYGNSAYLEWQWQRMGESTFGTILSTDSRIGNGGFTFTLSPDDVDTKVVFMCQLITD